LAGLILVTAKKKKPWSSHGMMNFQTSFFFAATKRLPWSSPGMMNFQTSFFFGGNKEDAMVKPWHHELSDLILLCQQRRGCHDQAMA
jgi:hypothetical protein